MDKITREAVKALGGKYATRSIPARATYVVIAEGYPTAHTSLANAQADVRRQIAQKAKYQLDTTIGDIYELEI